MEHEVLTVAEAAEFLRLTPYAVRRLARRGVLPGRKLGKEWRFYRPDLVAWLRGGGPRQGILFLEED
ncbi:MAG: helix-turn-helix domain-containing protein [Desulfobaccales bacterium]